MTAIEANDDEIRMLVSLQTTMQIPIDIILYIPQNVLFIQRRYGVHRLPR